MNPIPPPSKKSIDIILAYAPKLENSKTPEQLDEAISLFVSVIYASDFVISFDWMTEFPTLIQDTKKPEILKSMRIDQLRKLLIAHLRCDHFNEGHLRYLIQTGYLEKLLAQLKALRAKM